MEVGACVQDTRGHSASLLTRLNLQREQAQFCDCVVRQKQSPAQLYPAHRCVLAASSPVLGSVLSSSGALVELQAPCLSGSVLALLLDYIYTGALPHACTQQQHYSLLAAAHYLQMDGLQEALRAREHSDQTHISTEHESRPHEKISYSESCSIDDCGKLGDPEMCSPGSLETELAAETRPAGRDPRRKEAEADAATAAHSLKYANTSKIGRTAPRVTLQTQTRNISSTTEGYSASRVHKDMQKDQVHPAGTIKPETWQNTDEEMEGTDEDTRSSSSPTSSPPQCCGAVPVICHSGRASVFQVCTALGNARAAGAGHGATTAEHQRHDAPEDLGPGDGTGPSGAGDRSDDQRAPQTCYKCLKDQPDTLIEESTSSRVPLPVEGSGTGSHCWDFCPKGEVKEEHASSGKRSAELQTPDSLGDLCGPDPALYARRRAEASAEEVLEYEDTAALDSRRDAGGHHDRIPGTGGSEPLFGFTVPDDSDASDPTCSVVGQSYHGHVHYHCIGQDDTWHLSGAGYRRSHPSHRGHAAGEEEETCMSPGQSPLRQHFTAGPPEQLLLLDISTRHAELLVSYKDREQQEHGASGTETRSNDGEQGSDDASAVWPETGNVKAGANVEAECLHEGRHRSTVRGTRVKEGSSAARERSRSRAAVTEEASKHEEHDNQTSTRRMCSAASVPESAQASVSSALSVCIASANASARLSAPAHHAFQCSLCDRAFSQRGSLNRHVRSHLGVRPFPCPRCPMTFSRQYRVTEHMRVHQRCTLGNDVPHPPASSM